MHYKFKTEIELKGHPESFLIHREIRKVLEEFKADEIETNDNTTIFRSAFLSSKLRWSGHYMTIVDKGILTVNREDNKTKISLETYSSLWTFIIFLAIFCIVAHDSIGFMIFGLLFFVTVTVLLSYSEISLGSKSILNKVKERIENRQTDEKNASL